MDEKKEFIEEWKRQEVSLAELCRGYGISRQTGYKWLERYELEGERGLEEHSRAPLQHPQAMLPEVSRALVSLRSQHPSWGPRKLRAYLQRDTPKIVWPAASSIGDLLRREGLAHPRRKRKRTPPYTQPLQHAAGPNQVWCADFKGWFLTQDGARCDPLTITDAYSRYLIRCCAVKKTDGEHAWAVFEAAFREFGLPEAIRTDNGTPIRQQSARGAEPAIDVVVEIGNTPRTDRAGQTAAERPARAHASNAKAGDGKSSGAEFAAAANGVLALSTGVQPNSAS